MKRAFHHQAFLLFLAFTLLGACETVVDVALPPHEPHLVAQSFFTPDSLWTVQVTSTVPYASSIQPDFIDHAEVEIWDGDRLVARPTRTDSGRYVASGNGAVLGRPYTLRVKAPGFSATEGTDALPPPPKITAFEETLVQPPDSTSRRHVTRVAVTLEDPPAANNYYGLMVLQTWLIEDRRTGQVQPLPPSLFPFESADPVLGESTFAFLNADKSVFREVFFTDDLFDGSSYTLDFDIQYDVPHPDAETVIRRAFTVVLLAVSSDFYRYWKTAEQQALTNENPFAEPLRVHSNMTGGFGVFAGAQYRLFALGTGSPDLVLGSPCSLIEGWLPICGGASSAP